MDGEIEIQSPYLHNRAGIVKVVKKTFAMINLQFGWVVMKNKNASLHAGYSWVYTKRRSFYGLDLIVTNCSLTDGVLTVHSHDPQENVKIYLPNTQSLNPENILGLPNDINEKLIKRFRLAHSAG